MLARVIRAVKPAFLRLDDRVNAIRVCAGNCHTDFSENSIRETVAFKMFPGHAVIFRAIQTAARSAAREKPRLPPRLPKRCENDVRIIWVEHDIDAARVFVFAQNFRPRFAAIGGAKDSTLLIWTERMSERRYQHDVSIFWIDNQRADLPGIFQSDIFPRFSRVDRFVNANA